jgi:peptidoglycan/LPS O-acetylase OafA/YrhL
MLVYSLRSSLPSSWVAIATAVGLVGASMFLPEYRILGALPLAYALVAIGSHIKSKKLRLENDISYGMYIYAFPVQQVLAMVGLAWLNPAVFALTAAAFTAPLAYASWMFIEKPALRFKQTRPRSFHGSDSPGDGEVSSRTVRA